MHVGLLNDESFKKNFTVEKEIKIINFVTVQFS